MTIASFIGTTKTAQSLSEAFYQIKRPILIKQLLNVELSIEMNRFFLPCDCFFSKHFIVSFVAFKIQHFPTTHLMDG